MNKNGNATKGLSTRKGNLKNTKKRENLVPVVNLNSIHMKVSRHSKYLGLR